MAEETTGSGTGSWWWIPLLGAPSSSDPLGTPGVKYVQAKSKPMPEAQGPFNSRAEAEANYKENSTGIHNPSAPGAIGDAAGALSSAFGITELGHWIGKFVTDVTDIHMYISLGWLLLGLYLMIMGLIFWLRIPQKAAGAAAKVGTVAALAA